MSHQGELPGQGHLFAIASDPRPSSLTPEQGADLDRIARGEAVPGHRSACASEGCAHGRIWHSHTNRNQPCERPGCPCSSFSPRLMGDDD
jgi:hypothetical protein